MENGSKELGKVDCGIKENGCKESGKMVFG